MDPRQSRFQTGENRSAKYSRSLWDNGDGGKGCCQRKRRGNLGLQGAASPATDPTRCSQPTLTQTGHPLTGTAPYPGHPHPPPTPRCRPQILSKLALPTQNWPSPKPQSPLSKPPPSPENRSRPSRPNASAALACASSPAPLTTPAKLSSPINSTTSTELAPAAGPTMGYHGIGMGLAPAVRFALPRSCPPPHAGW